MKKTLGKRLNREEEKEVKAIATESASKVMSNIHKVKGTPYQLLKLSEQLQARAHNSVDIGYIRTLLYPELYNYDLPQPLSTQSYCRFTDRKDMTLKSSMSAGQSMLLLWYPKTVCGPQLFIRYGDVSVPKEFAFAAATSTPDPAVWRYSLSQDYTSFFSQCNLVAASIQIQYIGQLQLEQGMITLSQLYGVSPSTITKDDIENGQFKAQAKPGDGLRAVYIPKDMSDFQYYSCTRQPASGTAKSRNNGGKPEVEKVTITGSIAALKSNSLTIPPPADSTGNVGASIYPQTSSGTPLNLDYQTDGDCIALYISGMNNVASDDLRIDITRKFNGFPLASQRDILDLTKPKKIFDPKKTIDVIQELQTAIPKLCGHSIKDMDRVSDEIQEFIPNIGHLYDEGMLKETSSLEGFAAQLQGITGNEGPPMSLPGRIYD